MKILVVDNAYRASKGEKPSVIALPDTCLFRNNDPYFLPQIDARISLTAGLLLKIHKIGKSVQAEFANRYISEIGVGVHFKNSTLETDLINQSTNTFPAVSYDRSLASSNDFFPFEESKMYQFRIRIAETELTLNHQSFRFSIAEMLSAVTEYYTIKIGDLLFLPLISMDKGIHQKDIVDITLNNSHILRCQIK